MKDTACINEAVKAKAVMNSMVIMTGNVKAQHARWKNYSYSSL